MGKTTIVCGPPGSGKSRYVQEHAKHGDLIIDLDALAMALSGLPLYDKPDHLMPFVWEARDAAINKLMRTQGVTAWVIGGYPRRDERELLRRRLNATVVMLDVLAEECIARIEADPRRNGDIPWLETVYAWWASHD